MSMIPITSVLDQVALVKVRNLEPLKDIRADLERGALLSRLLRDADADAEALASALGSIRGKQVSEVLVEIDEKADLAAIISSVYDQARDVIVTTAAAPYELRRTVDSAVLNLLDKLDAMSAALRTEELAA